MFSSFRKIILSLELELGSHPSLPPHRHSDLNVHTLREKRFTNVKFRNLGRHTERQSACVSAFAKINAEEAAPSPASSAELRHSIISEFLKAEIGEGQTRTCVWNVLKSWQICKNDSENSDSEYCHFKIVSGHYGGFCFFSFFSSFLGGKFAPPHEEQNPPTQLYSYSL